MTFVSDVETTIEAMREVIDGEVCSRTRVVDALLDLRLMADDRPDLVDLIDGALTGMPGQTMVSAAWWREQLDVFELAVLDPIVSAEPVG